MDYRTSQVYIQDSFSQKRGKKKLAYQTVVVN